VLKDEVLRILDVRRGQKYIDATIGGAGHAKLILERGGIVLGIDQDRKALDYVNDNFRADIDASRLRLAHGNFKDIGKIAKEENFEGVSGILLDLGVSSYQIDNSGRGFSFMRDEPLDMRMDTSASLTASQIINKFSEQELYDIFSKLGEEPNSRALAQGIIRARRVKPIETTGELVDVIKTIKERSQGDGKHIATRIFQALRIAVNSELESLKQGLAGAFNSLSGGGKLLVISFHSLEDRIVKKYFSDLEDRGMATLITKKPITASAKEIYENRRARSAKLRAIARI
jgi:16S rRNA (cytosine1402-N4)-methyltransferase